MLESIVSTLKDQTWLSVLINAIFGLIALIIIIIQFRKRQRPRTEIERSPLETLEQWLKILPRLIIYFAPLILSIFEYRVRDNFPVDKISFLGPTLASAGLGFLISSILPREKIFDKNKGISNPASLTDANQTHNSNQSPSGNPSENMILDSDYKISISVLYKYIIFLFILFIFFFISIFLWYSSISDSCNDSIISSYMFGFFNYIMGIFSCEMRERI